MKKHQLLEKAMRDYPAGTKCYWPADGEMEAGTEFITSGVYKISNSRKGWVFDSNNIAVFDGIDWVETITVKPSILLGKVAIRVENERELDSVNKHNNTTWQPQHNYGFPAYLYLCYGRGFDTDREVVTRNGFKIIPFADFAAEVGIKLPVKIMTSEDGFDLYEGDGCYTAIKTDGIWFLDRHYGEREDFNRFEVADNGMFASTDEERQFSTKQAAEAWIKEQNKPKSKSLRLYNGESVNISEKEIHILSEGRVYKLMPSDLEDMLHALKSMKQ